MNEVECPDCDGEGCTPPTMQDPLGDMCPRCGGEGVVVAGPTEE